jgi:hypothetical protein
MNIVEYLKFGSRFHTGTNSGDGDIMMLLPKDFSPIAEFFVDRQ